MPTTLKQALVRMNPGHYKILENVRDTGKCSGMVSAMWVAKGISQCRSTLMRWGAIESVEGELGEGLKREYHYRLTDFGKELVNSYGQTVLTAKGE